MKNNTVTVEEIHETFYTEVDRLLEYAKISTAVEPPSAALTEKSRRLQALGFGQTKEILKAVSDAGRLEESKRENQTKAELIKVIHYFSMRYPQYKFITEESVRKICEKYNLVYGEIKRYKGDVPDKNLEHIEQISVKKEDVCWTYNGLIGSPFYGTEHQCREKSSRPSHRDSRVEFYAGFVPYNPWIQRSRSVYSPSPVWWEGGFNSASKCSLEIAAPISDFDISGMELKDYKLTAVSPPDPIILQPVVYQNKKYYLVITAWGDEASDENVVNEKMN